MDLKGPIRAGRLFFWALLSSCTVLGAAAVLLTVYSFIMSETSDNFTSTSAVGAITVSSVSNLLPSPVTPSTMMKKAPTAASTSSSFTGNAATNPTYRHQVKKLEFTWVFGIKLIL
nr:uncharacterized protein LOC129384870 [Dermacentor andersoni]